MSTNEEWYWSKKGSDERNGPVGRERLEKLAEEGNLESEDLVWSKGFDDWKEVGSVENLKGLFKTPPPLSDSGNEEKIAGGDGPPPLAQRGNGEEFEETQKGNFDFPAEFDVKWKGSVASNESTLVLRKKEISLHVDDWTNHGGNIWYNEIKVEGIGGNEVEITAPFGFDNNSFDRTTTLTFRSERLARRAVEIIEGVKSEEMGVGDQLDTEATGDREKVTATDEAQDPFWKRHPVWTGVIAVFLLGALSSAFEDNSIDPSEQLDPGDMLETVYTTAAIEKLEDCNWDGPTTMPANTEGGQWTLEYKGESKGGEEFELCFIQPGPSPCMDFLYKQDRGISPLEEGAWACSGSTHYPLN
jgi:hypothetical protein